jgi:hypothetical protein
MKFFATIALCALVGAAAAESTTTESARQLRAAAGDITKFELTPEGKSFISSSPSTRCSPLTCDFGGNMQACAPKLAARLNAELIHGKNVPGKGVYTVSGNAVTFHSTGIYIGVNRINTLATGTCDGRTFNAVCPGLDVPVFNC